MGLVELLVYPLYSRYTGGLHYIPVVIELLLYVYVMLRSIIRHRILFTAPTSDNCAPTQIM